MNTQERLKVLRVNPPSPRFPLLLAIIFTAFALGFLPLALLLFLPHSSEVVPHPAGIWQTLSKTSESRI